MRNAAELALSEFNNPDIQLLVKDDGGSAPGAQQAAQQLIDEGAEIILGPLFAHSVAPVGQLARSRGIPVIAFSTDSNVAAAGVYLLSFLPESDVERLVGYAAQQGKRSYAAAIPDNRLRHGGRGRVQAIGRAAQRPHRRARALHRRPQPDAGGRPESGASGERAPTPSSFRTPPIPFRWWCRRWPRTASIPARCRCSAAACGRIRRSSPAPCWRAPGMRAPTSTGFRNFSGRYRSRYNQDPVRTATLVYDAVALVAALTKTQGQRRFTRGGADQHVRLQRHRRPVPLPPRRHQSARPRGDAGVADRRADHQPVAALVQRLGDVSRDHAARSATTASSTGNPDCVTRSLPPRVNSIAPSCCRISMRRGSSARPASRS